jgi:hypothetical protein
MLSGIHPPSVMPDIGNRASILALLRMAPRLRLAGMTAGLRSASPTGSMVFDTVRQLIAGFL